MDIDDAPEPDYEFIERLLIRAGLLGFVVGLTVVYLALYAVWFTADRFFFGD